MKLSLLVMAAFLSSAAVAQSTNGFPPTSTAATEQDLNAHLSGKAFCLKGVR